eukprot:gb/GEZN01016101.1/.p1 GENE.gb/GEZN01016101.1/~~gb/GEZN01016101.1/.p1  ORF type:complete len:100 (+),score=0.52 gb/GEZN01016101.1/:118-417(+)
MTSKQRVLLTCVDVTIHKSNGETAYTLLQATKISAEKMSRCVLHRLIAMLQRVCCSRSHHHGSCLCHIKLIIGAYSTDLDNRRVAASANGDESSRSRGR